MTALTDLVLPDVSMTIEPLHLSITQTFSTGAESNLHLVENGDLGVKHHASEIIRSTEDGALLVAMSVDGDHDEVHYQCSGGADTIEILKRGIEALTLALTAAEQVTGR